MMADRTEYYGRNLISGRLLKSTSPLFKKLYKEGKIGEVHAVEPLMAKPVKKLTPPAIDDMTLEDLVHKEVKNITAEIITTQRNKLKTLPRDKQDALIKKLIHSRLSPISKEDDMIMNPKQRVFKKKPKFRVDDTETETAQDTFDECSD